MMRSFLMATFISQLALSAPGEEFMTYTTELDYICASMLKETHAENINQALKTKGFASYGVYKPQPFQNTVYASSSEQKRTMAERIKKTLRELNQGYQVTVEDPQDHDTAIKIGNTLISEVLFRLVSWRFPKEFTGNLIKEGAKRNIPTSLERVYDAWTLGFFHEEFPADIKFFLDYWVDQEQASWAYSIKMHYECKDLKSKIAFMKKYEIPFDAAIFDNREPNDAFSEDAFQNRAFSDAIVQHFAAKGDHWALRQQFISMQENLKTVQSDQKAALEKITSEFTQQLMDQNIEGPLLAESVRSHEEIWKNIHNVQMDSKKKEVDRFFEALVSKGVGSMLELKIMRSIDHNDTEIVSRRFHDILALLESLKRDLLGLSDPEKPQSHLWTGRKTVDPKTTSMNGTPL